MKTLVIDARMIGPFGHGISRYLEETIELFSQEAPLCHRIMGILGVSKWTDIRVVFLIRKSCPEDSIVRRYPVIEVDISCYDPRSWILIPRILKSLCADLFFNPTFASFLYLPCQYIQTVHDVNHLHFGDLAQKLYYKVLLRYSLKKARLILTVSKFIQSEIASWARIPRSKIEVFYNPVSSPKPEPAERAIEILNGYGLKPGEYFLCVSNLKPHKNLMMLMEAYRAYRTEVENAALPLILVVPKASETISTPGIRFMEGVTSSELSVLYSGCRGFYFPSLYEGFGRPPVEAALSGVPVYASDIPPHREAAELYRLMFNWLSPSRVADWKQAFMNAAKRGE